MEEADSEAAAAASVRNAGVVEGLAVVVVVEDTVEDLLTAHLTEDTVAEAEAGSEEAMAEEARPAEEDLDHEMMDTAAGEVGLLDLVDLGIPAAGIGELVHCLHCLDVLS